MCDNGNFHVYFHEQAYTVTNEVKKYDHHFLSKEIDSNFTVFVNKVKDLLSELKESSRCDLPEISFYGEDGYSIHCVDIYINRDADKIVGKLLPDSAEFEGVMLCAPCVNNEIIFKVLSAHIPVVILIARPTSSAVKIAQDFSITLIGLLDKNCFYIFSHPERLI